MHDCEVGYLFTNRAFGETNRPVFGVEMLGRSVKVLIDSGADNNIMDENTFRAFKDKVTLRRCSKAMYPYGMDKAIKVIGEFETEVRSNGKSCCAKFLVVKAMETY